MPKKPKWDETPCPECREPVSNEASRCPHCQAVYTPETIAARKQAAASTQKMTFGCLAIVLLILIATCSTGDDDSTGTGTSEFTASELASPSGGSSSLATEDDPAANLTAPQRNALRSAQSYLEMKGFSRQGLIEQLSSSAGDGYDRADATAAVDTLAVDWNEQAARSARDYLDMMGFSCNGLIDQLSSDAGDGFTVQEATYGARQAGAC